MTNKIISVYKDYPRQPYISPARDLVAESLAFKPVPRRNMEDLGDGLVAGDIILLWRIAFGTFTTDSVFPKYLEYNYGINGPEHLINLEKSGYTYCESAFDSLDHITATLKKNILKAQGVTGLSKMKVQDLDDALQAHLAEESLGQYFTVRGFALTDKGCQALASNQAVIDRHPKKKLG